MFKGFLEGYKDFRKNWKWIPVFFLVDVLFVFITGWLFVTLQEKIVRKLSTISDALAQASGMDAQAAILTQASSVFLLTVVLVLSLSLSWIILQGINYSIVKYLLKKKNIFWRFFLYHLVSIPVLVVVFFLYLQALIYNEKILLSFIPAWVIHGFFLLVFLILFCLMYIHYNKLDKFRFFDKELAVRFVLSMGSFVLLFILFYTIFWVNFFLSLLVLAIMLVFASYLRFVNMEK
ncbi:MAG: hypothetical protein ACLFP2_01110 [Candidatus Woesearchaeota archaeon]